MKLIKWIIAILILCIPTIFYFTALFKYIPYDSDDTSWQAGVLIVGTGLYIFIRSVIDMIKFEIWFDSNLK